MKALTLLRVMTASLGAAIVLLSPLYGMAADEPTPNPSATPTPSATPSPSPSPSPSATPEPSMTPEVTPTPDAAPTPTSTPQAPRYAIPAPAGSKTPNPTPGVLGAIASTKEPTDPQQKGLSKLGIFGLVAVSIAAVGTIASAAYARSSGRE